MTPEQRLDRLEQVLGTTIAWLHGTLSTREVQQLLEMLQAIKLEKKDG